MNKSVLKTKFGKFLMIQMINDKLKLCAEEVQNEAENAPLVDILTNEEQKKAYKFYYQENWYWMKADADKLEVVTDGDTNSEPFWFEREDLRGSEQYGLRFRHGSTEMYLSNFDDGEIDILTITPDPDACLIITHEKRN